MPRPGATQVLPTAGRPSAGVTPVGAPSLTRRTWLASAGGRTAGLLLAAPLAPWISGCATPQPLDASSAAGSAGPGIATDWPEVPVLLLGEFHDNPAHHALRAEGLLRWLSDARPAAVAFEPFGRRHTAALQAATQALGLADDPARPGHPLPAPREWTPADLDAAADRLAEAGQLDRRGWGWPLHRPLLVACLRRGARIVGANLEPEEARSIARQADAALPEEIRTLLAADKAWSAADQAAIEAEIDAGHCGLLPRARWPAMALAQRARDAAMALAVHAAGRDPRSPGRSGTSRVALIAGNGHVRRDLGVPRLLIALGMRPAALHAVGYLEAPPAQARSLAGSVAGRPAATGSPPLGLLYDQVVYTTALRRDDPCAGLARRLPATPAPR